MTKIRIKYLIWDEFNLEHIKKHNVSVLEIEEAIGNTKAHKYVKNGRFLLIGRTGSRILSVILAKEKEGKYYIVTARDAAKKERKNLYDKEE